MQDINYNKYKYGYELWDCLKNRNDTEICSFLKKMNLFKVGNKVYYHRLYSLKRSNIKVNGIFPHSSYYRLVPKYKKSFDNVITHTYEVQKYIYEYQHPLNCDNKKFLIIREFYAGHGSEIHVFTSYLAAAMNSGRIAIFDPFFKNMKAFGIFCNEYKNWLCFLEQLTNCTLHNYSYNNTQDFVSMSQNDKYLFINNNQNYKDVIPDRVAGVIKESSIYPQKLLHYWRIQAATYIFRLNQRTDKETNRIMHDSFNINNINNCFNIWIRHGDKYLEMKLLENDKYVYAYKLYSRYSKYKNPIYISTDDPKAITYFKQLNITNVLYINFTRYNDDVYSNLRRGDEMTLNFIADIKAAMHCTAFSGTRNSNVVRLIDELRSTVGLSANSIFFENGDIKFSDTSYENYEIW